MAELVVPKQIQKPPKGGLKKGWFKYHQLYILLIPGIIHYIIFRYIPMAGIVIAFQNYDLYAGIFGSEWVGLKHFANIINSNDFLLLIRNTFTLGALTLLWGLPVPVLFALMLNEVKQKRVRKFVQSVSYFPSLLSIVVVCSMLIDALSPTGGIINSVLVKLGLESHYFMIDPKYFRTIYVGSEVWQKFGYNAIIYFAAISSLDTQLFEAAEIDGCNRLQKIWYITLPGILPTICTMTILNAGNIFKIGADKVLLLYNPMTYSVADIFGTFVYRKGVLEANYSFASAAGLFESVVAFIFALSANKLSKKFAGSSLW